MRATTLAAMVFAGLASAFALLQSPSDPDLFWQLTSGEWILDHGRLLDQDIWSYTREGTPYSVGAWLGQVVMALAFRAAGWVGIDVLRAALVGVFAFFAARITLRAQPHPGWAVVPIVGTILVSRTIWGDRPQLFTLAAFPLVLDLLLSARLEHRVGRLVAVPIVFLLWANLHNSFVIGLVALAVVAADAVLERDRETRVPLLVTLAISVVATQVNPSTVGAIGRALSYAGALPGWIVEERALDVLSGAGFVLAFLLLVSIGAALLVGREVVARRVGAPPMWAMLIAAFVLLALAIQRNATYACILLSPFAAAMLPKALGRPRAVSPAAPRALGAAVAAVVVAGLATVTLTAAPVAPDLSRYPTGALAPLRETPGNLLNEYDWGGYLIRYAPEHRTFIDGRGSALFTRGILDDFERAVGVRPGYRDVLRRWDIAVALLRRDRPLAGALSEDGWRTVAIGDSWVLLGRP